VAAQSIAGVPAQAVFELGMLHMLKAPENRLYPKAYLRIIASCLEKNSLLGFPAG